MGVQIVFEFKKLDGKKRSRRNYLGEDGLLRFVTGIYGKNQPVAAMVGVLTDSFENTVPPLREALSDKSTVIALKLRPCTSKKYYDQPSKLFSVADFDAEHDRPPDGQTLQSPTRTGHEWPLRSGRRLRRHSCINAYVTEADKIGANRSCGAASPRS